MILAGFEMASEGRLTLNGAEMTKMPAEQRGFGMVFQGYALFPHMTVEQNIAFPLKVHGRSSDEIKRRVGEMIEIVGRSGHGHKRPSGLSGGQQQRVALARALAYDPSVLLLDEPFSALDKNLREQMQEEVRRLHKELGTTFIFVTHDQSEALALSSRIAIFNKGELQQIDTPTEIYERPKSRFVAEFLGEVNMLPIQGASFVDRGFSAGFEGNALLISDKSRPVSDTLAIRPEYMTLTMTRPDSPNAIRARISERTYLGADTQLRAITDGNTPITLIVPTARLPEGLSNGTQVWVSWGAEHGFFL
jgi:putative spermidine/putrescine transport system ATP-binding protein